MRPRCLAGGGDTPASNQMRNCTIPSLMHAGTRWRAGCSPPRRRAYPGPAAPHLARKYSTVRTQLFLRNVCEVAVRLRACGKSQPAPHLRPNLYVTEYVYTNFATW